MSVLIILTGHTRGLGAALAARIIADGHELLALGRHETGLIGDHKHREIVADLSEPQAAAAALDNALDLVDWHGIDTVCLINNAGVVKPIESIGSLDAAAAADAVTVNLTAPILLTNVFIQATADSGAQRRILNVSSGAAQHPYAGWGVYCASKAGLDLFTRTLALEAPARCRVAAISPGVVDTDMQGQIRSSDPDHFPMRPQFIAMHDGGALADAGVVAATMIDHLLSESFGDATVAHLSELSG